MFAATIPEIEQHIDAMTVRPRFFIVIRGDGAGVTGRDRENFSRSNIFGLVIVESPLSQLWRSRRRARTSPWFSLSLQAGDRVA